MAAATPPAIAPFEEDEDEDCGDESGPGPPVPPVITTIGEGDADVAVELKVTLGMVFLKIGPRALLLNPPSGDTNVAPPDGLRQGQ